MSSQFKLAAPLTASSTFSEAPNKNTSKKDIPILSVNVVTY